MGVGNNDYEDGRLYALGNDAADMSDGEERDGDLEIGHDWQDISASSTASVSIESIALHECTGRVQKTEQCAVVDGLAAPVKAT